MKTALYKMINGKVETKVFEDPKDGTSSGWVDTPEKAEKPRKPKKATK